MTDAQKRVLSAFQEKLIIVSVCMLFTLLSALVLLYLAIRDLIDQEVTSDLFKTIFAVFLSLVRLLLQ